MIDSHLYRVWKCYKGKRDRKALEREKEIRSERCDEKRINKHKKRKGVKVTWDKKGVRKS